MSICVCALYLSNEYLYPFADPCCPLPYITTDPSCLSLTSLMAPLAKPCFALLKSIIIVCLGYSKIKY